MKSILKSPKELFKNSMAVFFLAVVLLWLKTYAAYQIEFNLGIDNSMQEFLLFLNPLSSSLLFLGIALFFKGKIQSGVLIAVQFLLSFLLYANVVYYRFFNDFITVPVLMQTKTNAGQLGDSALSLMSPFDILYFADTILLIVLAAIKWYKPAKQTRKRMTASLVIAAAIITFFINLGLAEKDRPELLTRSFDRNYLVKYLGAYNFTVYDIIQNARSASQRAMADSSDITEVENYVKANYAEPNPDYFGKAKGMNVIYVSLESFQTFLIDYKLDGQEVTPFLNSLAHNGQTFYFKNYFHQTGQGKTSDAEFMMENSLYPMSQGAVFVNKAQNTYQAAPAILKTRGYTSASFHGNYKTFWNRNEIYKSFGYDRFFDAEYYNMTDENTKNYGLKDKPFFKESMPMLESLKQPFYTKFITLSNHFPFKMDEGDTEFQPAETEDSVVNHYFTSANYMDQALEQFFNDLKASGLYDNTVIVMYGDHYGISENHNPAMEQVLGKEIDSFEYAQLQRVPLFIHVPGVKGGEMDTYGGAVDVMPTLMHLLGVSTKDYMQIGSDLLSETHREVIPFRNGDFISPEYTSVDEKCYSTETGEELKDGSACVRLSEQAKKELLMSDNIVYKDLLRFHNPEGFEPINRKDYKYIKEEPAEEANPMTGLQK